MEYINLIKTLTNELDIAKNKIHELKVKLSTKELDIMNLKKEQICLLLEYNEYKNNQDIHEVQVQEDKVQEDQIYIGSPLKKVVTNINCNNCNITDSLLLNRKNRLKPTSTNIVSKKSSSGISKSIILNQRNNLKNVVINDKETNNIVDPNDKSDYAYMINAIVAKRCNDEPDELSESWI